jgi:hypothetical protein
MQQVPMICNQLKTHFRSHDCRSNQVQPFAMASLFSAVSIPCIPSNTGRDAGDAAQFNRLQHSAIDFSDQLARYAAQSHRMQHSKLISTTSSQPMQHSPPVPTVPPSQCRLLPCPVLCPTIPLSYLKKADSEEPACISCVNRTQKGHRSTCPPRPPCGIVPGRQHDFHDQKKGNRRCTCDDSRQLWLASRSFPPS